MSTRVCIVCDKCGVRTEEIKNGGQEVFIVRSRLAAKGWYSNSSGKDYCPKCKADKKNAHKA